jgi:glycosyltransferase involved in cell wall biosynthesis
VRLHLLGIPHTVTHPRFSHCAFTGKVRRFAPMLRAQGFDVTHYGVEGAESGATEQVDVLTSGVWRALGGEEPGTAQIGGGGKAYAGSLLYWEFNRCLVPLLRERVAPGDVICCPFGTAHLQALHHFPDMLILETGIGYPVSFARHRVFESLAWMHYHLGKQGERDGTPSGWGSDYDFVIPNYVDPSEWTLGTGVGGYLCYFGRLNADKGLDVVVEIAKARPDLTVVLCGQGDPTPWLTLPNVEYRPPLHGAGRDTLLGDALAVLTPTRYVEPFGGVAIEANLCGTPVLASDFGAFTETIEPGWNGYRCRTLGDWLAGVQAIERGDLAWSRAALRRVTAATYGMDVLGPRYAAVFAQLGDLRGAGWYSHRSGLAA